MLNLYHLINNDDFYIEENIAKIEQNFFYKYTDDFLE